MENNPINRQTRGRGATISPANRFEALHYEMEDWCEHDTEPRTVRTQFLRDDSQTIISYNNSPDIRFDASLNPYRGCEHGCAYCYARPTHEYLGFSAGIDFESRILVKPNAAELLATELAKPSWTPQLLALSGVTDAYQPIERKLRITRSCLRFWLSFAIRWLWSLRIIWSPGTRIIWENWQASKHPRYLFRLRLLIRSLPGYWNRARRTRLIGSTRSQSCARLEFLSELMLRQSFLGLMNTKSRVSQRRQPRQERNLRLTRSFGCR